MGVRGGQADGLDEEVEERGEARVECGSGKVRLGLPMTVMGKRKSMGDSSCYYIQSRQACRQSLLGICRDIRGAWRRTVSKWRE